MSRTARLPGKIRYAQPTFLENSSVGWDPTRQGVGSSTSVGDWSNTFIPIGSTPNEPTHRQRFLLATRNVPSQCAARITSLRQALFLRHDVIVTGNEPPFQNVTPFWCEVVTPNWCFSDGNVSWHLTVQMGTNRPTGPRFTSGPGTSSRNFERQPVQLLVPPALDTSPSGRTIPGVPIGSLGTFYDMRFPWRRLISFDYSVEGPADVFLIATVKQTDPESRVPIPAVSNPLLLPAQEDRFLQLFGDARYGSIGGAILAEIGPLQAPTQPLRGC